MSLPSLSIRRPVAVAMLFLAIVMLGAIAFERLPVDLLPNVAYPRLVVHTTETGAAPSEVERLISIPVEQAVSGVPGVEDVASVSREGISLVTVRFAWGTNMDFAALDVREKLDGLAGQLPERLSTPPTVLRLDPKSDPIMALSVSGDATLPQLKDLAEQVFRRRLEQIDGVAEAAVTGGLDREIHVEVDPERLEAFGLTLTDVSTALDAANANMPGGTIRQGRFRYALRTLGEFQSVAQIAGVPISPANPSASASPDSAAPVNGLTIGDVAAVSDGFHERESVARYNGHEAVGILVFKDAGANTVHVADLVEQTLTQLRVQYPSVRLEVANSQASFVSDAIHNVVQNLIQGGALAFLVLLLFLRDPRYPIAIGLAIPISVIATFALMDAFGVSLNVMSLGGLALGVGMLVDNSIVVLENTFRHRELGLGPVEAARLGADEVNGAITASTLTTIAVFGPIVYIQGVAGQLFGALSLAVAFSLLASLLVALTLLPMLAARWGEGVKTPSTGARSLLRVPYGYLRSGVARVCRPPLDAFERHFARFAEAYEHTLLKALRNRGRVMAASLALLVIAAFVATRLDRRFLPLVDQGEFRARLELPRGTPIDRTETTASQIETVLLADPSVAAVFTQVGQRAAIAGVETEESGPNTATLEVRLHDGESTDDALTRLRPQLAFLPAGALTLESGQATAIGKLLGGGEADLAVRLRGDDMDASLAYAGQLETLLAAVPSLANVTVGTQLGQPEMRIQINRERAASYGIDPVRIASTINGYMYGDVATEFVDFDQKVPIVVRLPDNERTSLQTLQSLRIDGVPLGELVSITPTVGPTEIRREAQSRLVPVYADVTSGGIESAISDVRAVLAAHPPPADVAVEVGGENEAMTKSFRGLAFAFSIALLLVFMILAAEFESFVYPFIVLLTVPMGLVGAILALWVTGTGINTMSLIGIVILAGIVDNDAVVKIDFINQMRREGLSIRDAILAAGHARLRPILMTTVTTLLGVLPMALALGRGSELRAPLAIAIFGGLFTSTALTLIVLPVIYEVVEDGRERVHAWARTSAAPADAERGTALDAVPGD